LKESARIEKNVVALKLCYRPVIPLLSISSSSLPRAPGGMASSQPSMEEEGASQEFGLSKEEKEAERRRKKTEWQRQRRDPTIREQERAKDAMAKARAREDAEVLVREAAARAQAREDAEVLAREAAAARERRGRDTAIKTQAREAALADFSGDLKKTPTSEQVERFDTHQTPLLARALFWLSTGRGAFRHAAHVAELSRIADSPTASEEEKKSASDKLHALRDEILAQTFTPADEHRCTKAAHDLLSGFRELPSCGSCGVRSLWRTYVKGVRLDKLACLQLKPHQLAEYHRMGEYKCVASVYHDEKTDKYYFLHPETVDPPRRPNEPATTTLCTDCNKSVKQ